MTQFRKKNPSPLQQIPDMLICDKALFTVQLIDRIDKGKELFERSISNSQELNSNEIDFNNWNSYNSEYLKQKFNNEKNEYKINYDIISEWGMYGIPPNTLYGKIQNLKLEIKNKLDFLVQLLGKVELLKSDKVEPIKVGTNNLDSLNDNHDIFIVHGHNTEVLHSIARTIEKLELNPIILSELPNAGQTIIEKFESNSNVGFAIILLTDDDEGKLKADSNLLKNRARQNVILELGYFIGKLGRDRVLPLYSEGVELPSDIHGLLYVPIDSTGTWKYTLVKELKAAGYTIDANLIL